MLGLDLRQTNELVLGISLVLGLPMYLLDLWLKKRIAFGLIGLFLFRWAVRCLSGPSPVLYSPWRGNILLILALVLLQSSKLRARPNADAIS